MSNQNSVIFGNQARADRRDGRDYIVAPGIPVQEQVMNTYLLPASEIEHYINAWNGTPVCIRHAKQNGGSVKVPNPDVPIIGSIYNAKWDPETKRMLGEYWIDIENAMRIPDGQTIIDAIRNNKILETSTAYWADEEYTPGTHNGRSYKTVHHNLRPDHVAIFPDDTLGACSVEDGCGVNRNSLHANGACRCSTNRLSVQGSTGGFQTSPEASSGSVYGTSESNIPPYKKGHLPTIMLEGYAFNKGSRLIDQLDQAKELIEKKGITKPVWVQRNEDGTLSIIDGNHRVHFAGELNIEQIPVRVVNHMLVEMDPEPLYVKWAHGQDQRYLNSRNGGSTGGKIKGGSTAHMRKDKGDVEGAFKEGDVGGKPVDEEDEDERPWLKRLKEVKHGRKTK